MRRSHSFSTQRNTSPHQRAPATADPELEWPLRAPAPGAAPRHAVPPPAPRPGAARAPPKRRAGPAGLSGPAAALRRLLPTRVSAGKGSAPAR